MDGQAALEAHHQVLAVCVDRPHLAAGEPVRPRVLRVARVRRLDRLDVAADQRGGYPTRRGLDRVALRHRPATSTTRSWPSRSCRKRQLARPLAEAELGQDGLDRRADYRLPVEALHAELADAPHVDVLGECLERSADSAVGVVAERHQVAAVLLYEQHRLAAERYHVRAGYARRAAAVVVALRP